MTMYEVTSLLWRRRVLVIAIAAAIFVLGAIAVVATRDTTYTARAGVLFDQPDLLADPEGASVPNKVGALLPTFCQLVASDDLVERIADESGESVGTVRGSLRCSPVGGTLVAELAATSDRADRSLAITAAAADAIVDEIEDRYSSSADQPRIEASVLRAPHRPGADPRGTLRSLFLVAVAGLVAAAAFAVAAEPHRAGTPTR